MIHRTERGPHSLWPHSCHPQTHIPSSKSEMRSLHIITTLDCFIITNLNLTEEIIIEIDFKRYRSTSYCEHSLWYTSKSKYAYSGQITAHNIVPVWIVITLISWVCFILRNDFVMFDFSKCGQWWLLIPVVSFLLKRVWGGQEPGAPDDPKREVDQPE